MPRTRLLGRATTMAALLCAVPLVAACGGVKPQQANVVAGKQLFVAKCGSCHQLDRAGTKGNQGPNLDAAFQQSLKDGFGRGAVEGVVYKQILYPNRLPNVAGVKMPAKLVSGEDARDVAAYVASATAKPGKDTGLLATAVKAAGGGTAVEKNGTLTIPADPGGQLAFVASKAIGQPGPVTIAMPNKSGTQHDIVIDGLGKGAVVANGGTSSFKATLEAGKTYTYYCSIPGHRQAGMQGTLTVK
ncbi:c-type cytochrome [Baekduia soli]|uniref:C-type cytochrome n=1 Tax=Baekduia soli TaxID=496014 RepID=A0A5B8UA44_9ACTN|nr:c-type cytochrome [Baekduia soli]QEC49915.1 c-type cytochrome [Baekduia soli]